MTDQPTITDETIDAAREAVLAAIPVGLSYGAAEHIGLGVVHAVAPHVAAHERQRIAAELTEFADRRRAGSYRYAPELDICARRSNDCVVNAYYAAASIARDGNRHNVHCSNCGDTKGGPFGHGTSECTWQPCSSAAHPGSAAPVRTEPEKVNPNPVSMEAALRLIGGDCERFTRGSCQDEPSRSPYAAYGADQWCDPCIARAGLAGVLPDPSSWTEPTEY